MAKNKSKALVTRTSTPSRKVEPKEAPAAPAATLESPTSTKSPVEPSSPSRRRSSSSLKLTTIPLEDPEKESSGEDYILSLIKKYDSLNEHKAILAFDRLVKEKVEDPAGHPAKTFSLTPDLEKDLLSIIEQKESDVFQKFNRPLKNKSNEYDKAKIIGQFDLLYRTLLRLGFNRIDVNNSFKATLSKLIEDHLDWLCAHVPYERMPVGFFERYQTEEDKTRRVTFLANALKAEQSYSPNQQSVLVGQYVDIKEIRAAEDENEAKNDVKARILQAAEQYIYKKEKNVNQKYAETKIRLMEVEKLLRRNFKVQLSDVELSKLQNELRTLEEKISLLREDWEFDANLANQLYVDKSRFMAEKARLVKESQTEAEREIQKEPLEKASSETSLFDAEGNDDCSSFGSLLDAEQSECSAPVPTTTVSWNVMELNLTSKFPGTLPREMLMRYCNKQKLGKQKFTSRKIQTGVWTSSGTVYQRGYSEMPLKFDLPLGLASSSKKDAEELAALFCLFRLDSEQSTYRVLPAVYKKLWQDWLKEKEAKDLAPHLEVEKEKMSFIVDLVDKSFSRRNCRSNSTKFASVDSITSETVITELKKNASRKQMLFNRVKESFKSRLSTEDYKAIKAERSGLPITAHREEILNLVKNNQVLIISGETGCGKSTQVPQFLAEHILECLPEGGSVICTQPRRISAISIAHRVSYEMGDKPKSTGTPESMVGYQIRLENKMSAENVLLFCTTGILLRRLESDRYLNGVTHVVVDEVHERTIESDFLLIVLKKLRTIRTDLRIILMSATVNAERFSEYFDKCPIISVPGRTYPVHVQYLEDIVESTKYVLEEDSPFAVKRFNTRTESGCISVSGQGSSAKRVHYQLYEGDSDEEDSYDPTNTGANLSTKGVDELDNDENEESVSGLYSRQTQRMIHRMDDKKINYELILELMEYICLHEKSTGEFQEQEKLTSDGFQIPKTGAILIFLPGINEIRKLYDLVASHSKLNDPGKFLTIALHSTLSSENQEKAFEVPPDGMRKIVLSTNIAETGVTISDVTIVIDTGMAKIVSYDDQRRVSRLLQKYVAKANAHQRRGRAGRVQEGVCFHMFTKDKYEYEMPDFETPEILRLPLEELCLRIKVCGLGNIRDVLDAALDQPTPRMVENAILALQEVQALSIDENELLTPLGVHLSNLPVDLHIGKMILYGAIFRCLDPILTIAAALSYKSPFIRPFGKEYEADAARSSFSVEESDFLTIYKAYCAWRGQLVKFRESGLSPSSISRRLRQFCKEKFLSNSNLEMIEDMKRQYLSLLVSIGFVKIEKDEIKNFMKHDVEGFNKMCKIPESYDKYKDSTAVIGAALTAGLYPKVAMYSKTTKKIINKNLDLKIHPSSMLFKKQSSLDTDFLVYNTVVMNSSHGQYADKVFMWEMSTINAVAMVLLATDMDIKHNQKKMIIDGWLFFDCYARTAVLLKFLRQELNNLLEAKMGKPELDLGQYNNDVMDLIVKTLESVVRDP